MSRKPRWQDQDPRFREESARYAEPVPSRELLLKTLTEARMPLGFDALAERLGIARARVARRRSRSGSRRWRATGSCC